ncbi:MAG: hypothetical protein HKN82_16880 [Akkermansiaceae bacterium]|nr:hypothetical protein [Akkermansiaceae bacterium]NNM29977.1 hypothetical protein [Akkermansiaceae bacterium]
MSEEPGSEPKSILGFLRQQRDELKLKVHLAGKEAQAEWERLEGRWHEIEERAEPLTGAVKEAAGEAGDQARKVTGAAIDVAAKELKSGYEKLRKLLD